MNALRVYRLADGLNAARFYLDGKRVTRDQFAAGHFWRHTDSYASRMQTRKDGSILVREYHCIRVLSAQDRAYAGLDPKFNRALASAWRKP